MTRAALIFCLLLLPNALFAQDILRVATWNAELSRKGPGLLIRDISSNKDAQISSALAHISLVDPDVILLTGIDTDFDGHTARALAAALSQAGAEYPFVFSRISNAGFATARDLDKDGRWGEAQDAQSYGAFHGQGGLVLLSRLPIEMEAVHDFSTLLWRDLPNARLPDAYFDTQDLDVLRVSSTNHWDVPVSWGGQRLNLLAFYATTPVFDGDEDRNGWRNADEVAVWLHYLDGQLEAPAPTGAFVLLGDANLDPNDGDGHRDQMQKLLADPRLQDPAPRSRFAASIANDTHVGDAALDTANWSDPVPGNLRVDYVLPSSDLNVVDTGVAWSDAKGKEEALFRHGLVWVDISRQ